MVNEGLSLRVSEPNLMVYEGEYCMNAMFKDKYDELNLTLMKLKTEGQTLYKK